MDSLLNRKVDFHPSVLIVSSSESKEFLFGSYDMTYPLVPFRGAVNFIGGNPINADNSPLDCLVREIKEEFDPNPNERDLRFDKRLLASPEDIIEVRDALLSFGADSAHADFYFHGLHFRRNKDEGDCLEASVYRAIFTTYALTLPQLIFENVRKQIHDGKRMMSEGILAIRTLDQLCMGKEFSAAHGTPLILGAYTGAKITPLTGTWARKIGKPRDSYDLYAPDFNHLPSYRRV